MVQECYVNKFVQKLTHPLGEVLRLQYNFWKGCHVLQFIQTCKLEPHPLFQGFTYLGMKTKHLVLICVVLHWVEHLSHQYFSCYLGKRILTSQTAQR